MKELPVDQVQCKKHYQESISTLVRKALGVGIGKNVCQFALDLNSHNPELKPQICKSCVGVLIC